MEKVIKKLEELKEKHGKLADKYEEEYVKKIKNNVCFHTSYANFMEHSSQYLEYETALKKIKIAQTILRSESNE